MLNLTAPALLKIRDGITINLALSVSQSVERDTVQYKLKDGIEKGEKRDDFDQYKADVVSFWFIDGKSLSYRVGEEITAEDFDRIKLQLENLQYRPK